jgi:hypothetical protein
MNLVLYNQLGDAFEVSATNWNQTLSLAMMYGWQPAGTLRPPLPFGLVKGYPAHRPWNGNYDSPHGQCASRKDAEALAKALDRVLTFDGGLGLEGSGSRRFREFLSSCRRGGFLICPAIADGSRVPAASGTKLSQPAVFGRSGRSVQHPYAISVSRPLGSLFSR